MRGDADAAFQDAPYVRREHFRVQRHTAVPMEPRGLLAEWDAEQQRMTVCGAAKVPFPNRRMLAKMMGLPETSVRMVEYDVGGGFGARGEFYPEDFLIPFAARLIGRPVKWIEDRRENLMATQPCARRRMRAGDRLRARRHHPRLARPRLHRSRRLSAHRRRHRVAQHRADHVGAVPHSAHPHGCDAGHDQQDAVGHLSRAGPVRGRFLPRAAVRHGGGRSRHRSRRVPPAQSDRRSGDALSARDGAGARHRRPSATAAIIG